MSTSARPRTSCGAPYSCWTIAFMACPLAASPAARPPTLAATGADQASPVRPRVLPDAARAVHSAVRLTEELVHYLGALDQYWPDLSPVDDLRRPGAGVPCQPGDL